MPKLLSLKSLKTRTVQNKFNIIISLIIVILLFGLVNFWISTKIMSGIRSYVGGEGLWSKAQKEAVNNLVKYTNTHDESDYNRYQSFIKVPMGDKQARLELDKPHPNLAIVRQGFIQGGNNPKDVNDLIFLYRRFRHVSYMSAAISTWTRGDQEISSLLGVGDKIHQLISVPIKTGDTKLITARDSEIATLLDQTYDIDNRLTVLENQFSAQLGDGSRNINNILLYLTGISTTILGTLTLIVAILIAKALIRLDKIKTEFVSLASHQLRTPLTIIKWYGESLLSETQGELNQTQKKYLHELYDGGQRMSVLISDLLSASSLDLGTYKSRVSTVDVVKLLDTIVKDQQLDIQQKNISLTTDIDPGLSKVNLDDQFLTAILQNLLSNSVKYSRRGGRIHVGIQSKKNRLLIQVSDSGIGIPKTQQPQIFAKLFRAENAKQLSANGTGLGLYIVKSMVNTMGGSIRFNSVENQGTTFYVKIPTYGRSHNN